MSLDKMRSNGKTRVKPFPSEPSRDRSSLKPYRVWLKSFPKYPYIAIVWATSLTQAKRSFAEYLTANKFRLQRSSPDSYDGVELTPKFAVNQKPSILLGEKKL